MGAHRTPVLGHIDCPVCGLDMDIKKDKNGHAMGYCPDCSQQLFTRNDYRSGRLLELMRPVGPAPAKPSAGGLPLEIPTFLPPAAPAPAAKPAPKPQEAAQDVKTGSDKETPAPAEKNAPAPATQAAGASPKPRAAWFAGLQPIVKGKADGKR
jgi:hypothetical protein